MRLTKQTNYAIRILVECAIAGDRLIRISEVARRYRITEHNLFKALPPLVRDGFVRSVRGRNGGVRLARKPEEIRLGDVVRATEITHVAADCSGEPVDCAMQPSAPINRILDGALEAFIDVLNTHTLVDLVSGPRARPLAPEVDEIAREAHDPDAALDRSA